MSIQTCEAHESDVQCQNGVSWITVGGGVGYCEFHARNAPEDVQVELRHIYYGEPLVEPDDDDDPVDYSPNTIEWMELPSPKFQEVRDQTGVNWSDDEITRFAVDFLLSNIEVISELESE